jgi:hypothetical protein
MQNKQKERNNKRRAEINNKRTQKIQRINKTKG